MVSQQPFVQRYALPVAALALWCAALYLPSIDVRGGPVVTGFELFVRGWEGVARGLYAWLANPFFIVAFVASLFPRYAKWAFGFALAALLLGASSFFAASLFQLHGTSVPPLSFEAGFYLWLAAPVVLTLHALAKVLTEQCRSRRMHH